MAQADSSEQKQGDNSKKSDDKVEIDFDEVAQLTYIDCHKLAQWITEQSKLKNQNYKNNDNDKDKDKDKEKAKENSNKFIIIDVRDYDYGPVKIQGSVNKPASDLTRNDLKLMAQQYKDFENIIFHCRFSQQRGPSAARGYKLEKASNPNIFKNYPKQNVLVLEGGIIEFKRNYKKLCQNVN